VLLILTGFWTQSYAENRKYKAKSVVFYARLSADDTPDFWLHQLHHSISPMTPHMNINWLHIALVFVGGGVGSVARFLVAGIFTYRLMPYFTNTISKSISGGVSNGISNDVSAIFPFATLCINVIGSLCIGVVIALSGESVNVLSPSSRMLLAVGFCGGFTTFSTFSLETFTLLQNGRVGEALLYAALSLVLCIVATSLGLAIVYWWWKNRPAW
jgi:fluoride exporter